MYPVMLNVRGKRCLVVGGGGVALRKVEGLLADGAVVTVIAEAPIEAMVELGQRGQIALNQRAYRSGEALDFRLVFAATDDRVVNRQVFEDAEGAGLWANVADDPELCSFHLPARVRRGAFQLCVASAGEAPFAVRRIRQMLEQRFGQEWSAWAEAAARFRLAVYGRQLSREDQERCFAAFFNGTVDREQIRARIPSPAQEAAWLTCGAATEDLPARACEPAAEDGPRQSSGFVSLVGGGPGDPGLMTVRGLERLRAADAVVYDRLAMTSIPCDLAVEVELHAVGKRATHHPLAQEEINALLVRLGKEGKRVVRLKGGDPYVFGRGGEEAEALRAAGIPFEVVPSVTAGVAVPAYAGIPVTHRREVVRVTLVTAHESEKDDGPQVRWDLLAADPHATLVGYMGVTSFPQVAEKLMAAGLAADTPAAFIQRGTTSQQKTVIATVATLDVEGKRAGIRPPALFVIGPTLRLAENLDWFGTRPLLGHRLVVPAPAGALGPALQQAGAEVLEVPLPVTPAARVVMSALPLTGCVLGDVEQLEALEDERDGAGWSPEVVAWCLAPAVAARAQQLGWRRVVQVDAAEPEDVVAALQRPA